MSSVRPRAHWLSLIALACAAEPATIADTAASTDVEVARPRIAFADASERLLGEGYSTLGVAFVDFDDDLWPDITLATERGVHLLRNVGGRFEDVTESRRLAELSLGEVHGVVWGDLDSDGDLDLFVTRFAESDALILNDGGYFRNASAEWGLPAVAIGSHSATLGDLDGDRDLDVFVATGLLLGPGGAAPASDAHPDRVYRNDTGRFTEVAQIAGLAGPNGNGDSFIGLLVDLDVDGDLDVLSVHDLQADHVFINDGQGHFSDAGLPWITNASTGLMGLDAADVDGDGLLDIYATNFGADVLYLQRPDARPRLEDGFGRLLGGAADPTDPVTGWGCALIDADNDGDLEPLSISASDSMFLPPEQQGTPREGRLVLFDNQGGAQPGSFVDVSDIAGAPFGLTINGYGLATGDYDRDGAVDVVIGAQKASRFGGGTVMRPMLLRNEGGGGLRRLSVRLTDPASPNTHAIGARVDVLTGERRQARIVTAGASFLSAHDLALHFGLGSGTVQAVAVTWPGGARDEYVGAFEGEVVIQRGRAPEQVSIDQPRPP